MPKGNVAQSKVHYQGKEDDFVVLVEDAEIVSKWKEDRSIPLSDVVSGFKIFITHKYVMLKSYPAWPVSPPRTLPHLETSQITISPVQFCIFSSFDPEQSMADHYFNQARRPGRSRRREQVHPGE